MAENTRESILAAARRSAQTRGYHGLNFRELADEVGVKGASVYYHFPSKADLAAAVARRYWEDATAVLAAIADETPDPVRCLRRFPETFRHALATGNRLCLCSFMAAEYDDLPDPVKAEVQAFADVNVAWLARQLSAAYGTSAKRSETRARAIFAAVTGAQLVARSRSDVALYDAIVESYRTAGLFAMA